MKYVIKNLNTEKYAKYCLSKPDNRMWTFDINEAMIVDDEHYLRNNRDFQVDKDSYYHFIVTRPIVIIEQKEYEAIGKIIDKKSAYIEQLEQEIDKVYQQ